jgi:hypothetical protein
MKQINVRKPAPGVGAAGWLRENWWWPVVLGLLTLAFVGLTLIGRSAGPTEIKLKLRVPEHLQIGASTFNYLGPTEDGAGGSLAYYVSGLRDSRVFTLTNTSAKDAIVRLEGLESMPDDLRFSYGVVEDPSEFRRTGRLPSAQAVASDGLPTITIPSGATVTVSLQLWAGRDAMFGQSRSATVRFVDLTTH